jgi:hypothetical protein
MHKLISTIILLALAGMSLNAVGAGNKELVCHDGKTINVSQSAVSAHLGHGDSLGSCGDVSFNPGTPAAVVMMRCAESAGNVMEVVSFSASFDYASIQPVEPVDCAVALATLLDAGFHLRSVTSGGAGVDYLFLGRVPSDG